MADSKYQQIVRSIQDKIRRGVYPPGGKLPGCQALARQYKVSVITSNRALLELERMGFVQRRERFGTFVLESPKVLTDVIIVVNSLFGEENQQHFDYWRGAVSRAEQIGISIQTIQDTDAKVIERICPDRYTGQGVIFLGTPKTHLLGEVKKTRIPHVCLGQRPDPEASAVLEDRHGVAAELVKVLVQDGHRKIGFIGNLSAVNHRQARDGYLEGIGPLGLGYRYIRDACEENVVEVTRDLLAEDLAIDALILMGGHLPIAALATVLASRQKPALAVLTENASILQLRDIAFIGYYSQHDTGKMAVDLLSEIAAGKLTTPVIRLTPYRVARPKEKIL